MEKKRATRPHSPKPHGVVINPLLVATIQRLPQKTTESTFPSPGTVSPRAAFHVPRGPSKVAMPLTTLRTVEPLMVVGLVSGTGTNFRTGFAWRFFAAVCESCSGTAGGGLGA